jgi:hypothetical protein
MDDFDGHGTCLASCVGGVFSGVNKRANIVPVKINVEETDEVLLNDIINAIGLVLMDVGNNGVAGVINMSFGIPPEDFGVTDSQEPGSADPFPDLLGRLSAANVVIVASAGNSATADISADSPRRFGGANTNMIVVGSANENGLRAPTSTFLDSSGNNILSIYAQGVNVMCAFPTDEAPFTKYISDDGTSFATAQISGLVSIYLALGMANVGNVKSFLLQQAVTQKGLDWPFDQGELTHPRAGIAVQVTCTPTDTADIPFATVPPVTIPPPSVMPTAPSVTSQSIISISPLVSVSGTLWY